MIKSIVVKNNVTLQQKTISKEQGSLYLDLIDWDVPQVEVSRYRVPYQIGSTPIGTLIESRKPVIEGYIIAKQEDISKHTTWEEYYMLQEASIEKQKLELDRLFSVFQDVTIEVNGRSIVGRPTHPIRYSVEEEENNEVLCRFQIELECFNPMFMGETKNVKLATTENRFKFPMVIPKQKGIIFGELMKRQSVLVNNEGDSDVGCIIVIEAKGGDVANPKLYSLSTDEFIQFENVVLHDGDYIRINSHTGEEEAIKHDVGSGKDIPLEGNMVEGSSFMRIKQGGTFYAYSVDEQYKTNIDVTIQYTEQYFNVRGM